MRVVFFGTPDFAVATLSAIYHSEHEVIGVVTAPDKPAGRGLQLQSSDVKKFACDNEIPLLQPEKLKNPEFVNKLVDWQADVFVVVAFRMLPYEVYSIPQKGTFNVHASLLPQYRGAAPINWTIMNGETKTGVTTFFLNNEIDCGNIILQKEIDIFCNETAGELYDRLKKIGADLALDTLAIMKKGNISSMPQCNIDNNIIKPAPKIKKEDTFIDWNQSAQVIINKIRGLSPYPGAQTFLIKKDNKPISLKLYEASVTSIKSDEKAGTITTDEKSFLHISTKDFQISIKNLQIEGKKRLNIVSFLQGFKSLNYTLFLK